MLKGFRCPSNGEAPGRDNELSYCISKCKRPCVSPNLLVAMYSQERQNPHKDKVISATMLVGGCKRKTILERNVDYFVEPERKLPTFRGSLVHSIIETSKTKEAKKARWLVEEHMELPVTTASGSWTLSATLDFFDRKRATLTDTKTLQEYAVNKLVTGKENGTWSNHISDQYVKQANIYAYMGRKLGLFEAKKLRLQIVGFGKLILTGTTVTHKVRKGNYYREEDFYVPDIPILSDDVVESWINYEGDLWYRILFGGEPADVCEKDWAWLCKYCQFNGTKHCPDPNLEREMFDV